MKYTIILLLLIVLTSCHTATDYYEEGKKCDEKGNYEEAIKLLDKAIAKRPDFLDAFIARGYEKLLLSKYKEALSDFEHALTYDRKNTRILFDIGCAKRGLEDWKGALEYYNAAIATKGGPYITMDHIENNFINDPAVKYDVTTAEILFYRGDVYLHLDSLTKAYYDFRVAADKKFNTGDAFYSIAYICFICGKNVEGCGALNQAIMNGRKDINPKYLELCGMH
ncbi:MAG TPA: hypothetical protein VF411_15575 [Bacteroidia bacterium]